jgi:putative ABC transport system permease protein
MGAIIRLALTDLKNRWALTLVMSILFSITFALYLSLITYQKSLTQTYFSLEQNWLVVQQADHAGEIHGSRITTDTVEILKSRGYDQPIPEIHQVVGTSISNAIMLRGMRLEDLYKVSPFTMISGRALSPGDLTRLAMVGENLARRLKLSTGDKIKLRGRDFDVVGIFKTGSYEDSQAWISLADAQNLLNYGSDVSIYFIPDDGSLQEGANLSKGVAVSRRGDSGNTYGKELKVFFRYLGLISGFLGVATVITLTNLLWRLSWLHRREFGIIRTVGFGPWSVVTYLITQSAVILGFGMVNGGLFAVLVVIARIQNFSGFGISLPPVWDLGTISLIAFVTLIIAGIGIALPAAKINRMTVPELLGRE